jgi:late competence protein required for DNA uptake (superfamily II DNA/RNA helicase)
VADTEGAELAPDGEVPRTCRVIVRFATKQFCNPQMTALKVVEKNLAKRKLLLVFAEYLMKVRTTHFGNFRRTE